MRFKNKKSIALALSGGGIKAAAFHIGVCLALEEKGFKFRGGLKKTNSKDAAEPLSINTYVGSSAGAMISTFLASGYTVEDLIVAFEMGIKKRTLSNPRLKPLTYWDIFALNSPGFLRAIPTRFRTKSLVTGGFEAFLKNGFKLNGLFSTRGLEKYLRNHVLPTNDFNELASKLYIVATALNSSRKAIFGPHAESNYDDKVMNLNFASISDAAAASMSLPPVYCPYGIRNERSEMIYFFDGEIRDTLSTHVAADNGADLVIASYSIQPYHYNEKMGSLHEYGIPLILNQALYQVVEQKILKNMEYQDNIKGIYKAIDSYFKEANLPEEHKNKILEIVERRTKVRGDVDYMYIHPNPQDYEMFFVDHFSLNREILERIVKIGFKSALKVLRKYDI
jgi:predicted acylesterase/phospholipase RssA